MSRWIACSCAVALAVLAGCSGGHESGQAGEAAAPSPDSSALIQPQEGDFEPQEPAILPRPFTAQQIRDEWIPGLRLLLQVTRPEGEAINRWTVVDADDTGVAIEYARLDADGNLIGEPRVERSTWVELQDHATYSADTTTREEVTRDTPLGRLDGWLYTRRDPAEGTVTEFFFARDLPGAPVQMISRLDGKVLVDMEQIERSRPDSEP